MSQNKNYEKVTAEEVIAGADLSESYGTKVLGPDVGDVGQAINDAIAELAPEGGVISLPQGPANWSTQVSLNAGDNNQFDDTPIVIKGPVKQLNRNQAISADANGVYDATSLSVPAIKHDDLGRMNVHLRDFSLIMSTATAIQLGDFSNSGAATTSSTLRNIAVSGGQHGFRLEGMYGCEASNLYATDVTAKAFEFIQTNAFHAHNIRARQNVNDGNASVVVDRSHGSTFEDFYIESNDGWALDVVEDTASTFDSIYMENNNRSGSENRAVRIGDASSSEVQQTSFRGLYWSGPANAYSSQFALLNDLDGVTFQGWHGNETGMDIISGTADQGRNVWIGNKITGDVDTTNAANGSTWIQNQITGTVSRPAGSTVVSGD
jgi:hypothetical protein